MKKIPNLLLLGILICLLCACSRLENMGQDTIPDVTILEDAPYEELLNRVNVSEEWSANASVDFWYSEYEFEVGETTDQFKLSFTGDWINYEGNDAFSIQVTSVDSAIVEVLSFEKDKIMDQNEWGGITVKCRKEGTTYIRLTMIQNATGGIRTSYAKIIVVDPASTQPAETTP